MSFITNLPDGWTIQAGVPVLKSDVADLAASAAALAGIAAEQGRDLAMSIWDTDYSHALQRWSVQQPPIESHDEVLSTPAGHSAVLRACDAAATGELSQLAWVSLEREEALTQLQNIDSMQTSVALPLKGIPIGLKDMFDRQGKVAQWGCTFRKDAAPAVQDATIYARLIAAGAINIGTLHMAECALSPTGMNVHLGPGRNPCDKDRVSGGSSSGSAMVVGAGQVPLAIGSDTGGSIRIPAAFCGIYGLKPTQYRVSLAGAMPLSPSLDCVGPLANSLDLTAAAFAVMAGQDDRDPMCMRLPAPATNRWKKLTPSSMTMAVPTLPDDAPVSAAMRLALQRTIGRLKAAGITCVPAKFPEFELMNKLSMVILATEAAAQHRFQMMRGADHYGQQVRRRIALGYMLGATDYADAIRVRSKLLAEFMSETLAGADACLVPAVPDIAPLVSDTTGPDIKALDSVVANTVFWCRPFNYLGLPSLSFPMALPDESLPLGGQLVGAPLGEDALFALAGALL